MFLEKQVCVLKKIGVWCALWRTHIIGSIFFTSMVDANVYQDIITQFILLSERSERDCCFQQDGAPSHTAGETLEFLPKFFGERPVSKGLWPPRGPDLSPCDFFLRGHLKNRVFQKEIPTIEELKRHITAEINAITPSQLKKVFNNLMKPVALCEGELGTHFQQFLWIFRPLHVLLLDLVLLGCNIKKTLCTWNLTLKRTGTTKKKKDEPLKNVNNFFKEILIVKLRKNLGKISSKRWKKLREL